MTTVTRCPVCFRRPDTCEGHSGPEPTLRIRSGLRDAPVVVPRSAGAMTAKSGVADEGGCLIPFALLGAAIAVAVW